MALTGRLHPLLVHLPIALILIAAVAEIVSVATRFQEWHTAAVANVRAGAAFAMAAAVAGWLLASSRIVEASPGLEWHRWLGLAAAGGGGRGGPGDGGGGARQGGSWGLRMAVFWGGGRVGIHGHLVAGV